jgi:pyridoxine 5'-phosphate synthase PdxJ
MNWDWESMTRFKLDNIRFFKENIPDLLEVSIGHALITESLYLD